jgi:divalent metal cation (Fe/Co/Zn/Cd) transporter
MNVSCACGMFFSAAFNSVPMAMAYLVPFDYILMITSGVFIKLESLTPLLSFLPYFSWLMYGNEAMSIVQWENVNNIRKLYAMGSLINDVHITVDFQISEPYNSFKMFENLTNVLLSLRNCMVLN